MIRFEEKEKCSSCGRQFDWIYTGLKSGEVITGRWDEIRRNVIDCNEGENKYTLKLSCPYCGVSKVIERKKSL